MEKDIKNYIPKHRLDNFYIDELLALEDEEIGEIYFELIVWLKDMSQPIAKELLPVLIKNPKSLLLNANKIFDNVKADTILKYNIMEFLLNDLSLEDLKLYEKSLRRIAEQPVKYELFYETDKAAQRLLNKIRK